MQNTLDLCLGVGRELSSIAVSVFGVADVIVSWVKPRHIVRSNQEQGNIFLAVVGESNKAFKMEHFWSISIKGTR